MQRALANIQPLLQAFITRLADFGVNLLCRMIFSQIAHWHRRIDHVGVGGEYAFNDWLSAFVEYDYYGFGTRTNTFVTPAGLGFANIDTNVHANVVKAGLNLRFNPWR